MSKLFPKEIINNSAEANFKKHSASTKLIYSTVVGFIIASFALLPFIYIDVSVQSKGVVKPLTDRNVITSPFSGRIKEFHLQENKTIKKGEKTITLATPVIDVKLQFNSQRQNQVQRYLNDLALLQQIDPSANLLAAKLKTQKYQRSIIQFKQKLSNTSHEVEQAIRRYNRNKRLFEQKVLSEADFDNAAYSLKSKRNSYKLLLEQKLNKWKSDQISYRDKLDQLKTEKKKLVKERNQRIITAPVSGTIQNIKGVYEGSFVSLNQMIAEISPDTELIAESYVPPKDIGLIRKGMEARFQVSAFDYNQWGTLTGVVTDVSNDVTLINKRPVFIVRSKLDQTHLELENGYRGELKKGMTMQTRFTITKRTLFQLLYDNVDDWLNPKWNRDFTKNKQTSM